MNDSDTIVMASKRKSLDELKIDADILILEIGDLNSNAEKESALLHMEDCIQVLRETMKTSNYDLEEEEEGPLSKRRKVDWKEEKNNGIEFDTECSPPVLSPHASSHSHPDDEGENGSDPQQFSCEFCEYKTGSSLKLRTHMSRHTSNIKCELCDAYFSRQANLKRHQNGAEHKAKVKYVNASTNDVNTRDKERGQAPSKNLKTCPFGPEECKFVSGDQEDLDCHLQAEHMVKCQFCDLYFRDADSCAGHIETAGHEMKGIKRLRSGYASAYGTPSPYKCSQCNFQTEDYKLFKIHFEMQHNSGGLYEEYNEIPQLEVRDSEALSVGESGSKIPFTSVSSKREDAPDSSSNSSDDRKVAKKNGSVIKHLVNQAATIKCTPCGRIFLYQEGYDNHIKNNDCGGNISASSPSSPKHELISFNDPAELRGLVQPSASADSRFGCPECGKTYSRKEYLTSHMIQHTDRFRCGDCSQAFSNRRRLDKHRRNPGNCAKLLKIRETMRKRLSSSGKQPQSLEEASTAEDKPCPLTSSGLSSENIVLSHDIVSMPVSPKSQQSEGLTISCQHHGCGKSFSNFQGLQVHLERCHPYDCDGLEYELVNQDSDDQAISYNYQEGVQEVEMFTCDQCDKLFSSKQSLANHLVSHTDRFKCNNCNLGFSSKRFLEQHIKNKDNCEKLIKKRKESTSTFLDASNFVVAVFNDSDGKHSPLP